MRQGAELIRATNAYAKEDRALTWRMLVTTGVVMALFELAAIVSPIWPIRVVAAVLAGLTWVRLFIFYHDTLHGALFHGSRAGQAIMTFVGLFLLNPPAIWKESHDYHHKNNAKMVGAAIGSYPVVTTTMWKEITPSQRRWYAIARHPLTMVLGYAMIFTIGMCITPFRRDPKKHWGGMAALAVHHGLAGALWLGLGWQAAVFGVYLPVATACTAGAYLFYAQHNFPGIELRERRAWDYNHAALKCSSMFEMGPIMHWFTGNIGYHHVHHLNHRIPFYRLAEAMAAMPELQAPGRTSWRLQDVSACLRLKLWDPERNRMISWDELRPGADSRAA